MVKDSGAQRILAELGGRLVDDWLVVLSGDMLLLVVVVLVIWSIRTFGGSDPAGINVPPVDDEAIAPLTLKEFDWAFRDYRTSRDRPLRPCLEGTAQTSTCSS